VAERLRRSTGELTAWEHAHPPQQPTNGATGIPCIEIDGQPRVASASNDHTVRVWDPTSGATAAVLKGHTSWVRGVAWGEIDGQPRVASASDDATVRVWDPASGATVTVLAIMRPCHTVALRRDRLAIGTDRGVIGLRFLTDSR